MLTHPIRVGGDATPGLSRRELLQGAGVLFGTLWASSGALLALAPSRTWALVYALVVKDLDAEAGTTEATKTLLTGGVAGLDKASGGNWLEAPRDKQAALVKSMAGTPFFEKVRGKAITSLYNNELAFAHFGYEGNAWRKGGGYLTRGFNDLKWLPNPPEKASPKPFLG